VFAVADASEKILGFRPVVTLAPIDSLALDAVEAREVFVLPVALDFNLLQREALGRAIGEARRANPQLTLHHDDLDPIKWRV
jgi:hypothetical protein